MGGSKVIDFLHNFTPKALYNYHYRCINNFGLKFMSMMLTTYLITTAFMENLIANAETPFYREAGYFSDDIQVNTVISGIPSSLKGLFGVISDSFPLFGYHKASYMYLTAILSATGLIIFVTLPDSILHGTFLQFPAFLLFFPNLQAQFHDLMTQGKFVEMMIAKPESKSDLVTFSWFYQTFGQLVPILVVGPYSDSDLDMKYLFIAAIPLSLVSIITLSLGCMVNDKVPKEQANKIKYDKLKKYGKISFLAMIIACCAILSVVFGTIASTTFQFIYSIFAAIVLTILCLYCLPVTVAKACIYIFLCDMVYLNMAAPFFFWFTANEECVPGGPKFDTTYYITYVGLVGVFCKCLGIVLFQTIVCNWKLRHIYWVTTLIRVIASFFDIVIVQRWNISIGIPDKVMFMMGNTLIYQTVYMMDFMPSNLLIAKLCPKTVEATVFAIIAGFANYGVALGSFIGVFLQDLLNVYGSETQGCNYDNFVYLILLCNFVGPIINIINTFWLIPNVKITEDFVKNYYENKSLNKLDSGKVPDYVKDAEAVL